MAESSQSKPQAPQSAAAVAKPAQATGGPLSAEQLDQLEAGRKRAKKVRRAAAVAVFSGWSLALFAMVSLAMGVFGDWGSLATGAVLAAAAFNELRGAEGLRRFEAQAAKRLGYGQLALGVLVVAYAGWSWYVQSQSSPLAKYGGTTGSAEVDAMLMDMTSAATPIVWGSVGVVGLVSCWLLAAYYFASMKALRGLRERTPEWVIEVLKKAG